MSEWCILCQLRDYSARFIVLSPQQVYNGLTERMPIGHGVP